MMLLRDVRDLVASLNIAEDEHCYCGKLPDKKEKSIGTYPLSEGHLARIPLGGSKNASYEIKYVSFLIHWTESVTDTEQKSIDFYNKLKETKNVTVNAYNIKFIMPTYDEPIPVGTDESGIYEYVIECAVYYESEEKEHE